MIDSWFGRHRYVTREDDNERRLLLKRRRPTAIKDWHHTGDVTQWRWHIITELARDKVEDMDEERQ